MGKRQTLDYEFPFIFGEKPLTVDSDFGHIFQNENKDQIEFNIESLRDHKEAIIKFLEGEDSRLIKSIVGIAIAASVLRIKR
ncbi:hypothetical protein Phi46:3_gp056 [Cellulophaga phage phi46:3]|uniref:Uncharacterized protein n=1 Tax=Cellulophaga phage phi46:3 TaxID=1327985 RepID=S0A1W9_9CAUD|nr:hypothetical protein Phi46:3_gp056 [Cellulophaga phage phi46:3]AGO48800.1 hypothetical protein Phi46:3_gp056 [Cellulophaga phage phi46:3]